MKNSLFLDSTTEMLQKYKSISLQTPISSIVLEKLKHVNENCEIYFDFYNNTILNEKEYYNSVKYVLEELNKDKKNYKIRFNVNNRKIFSESNIINNSYDSLKVTIDNEGDNYTFDEYRDNDKRLDELVSKIQNKGLSPLERFIYVYDIVKKFRDYKLEPKGTDIKVSRNIKYILDSEYLVCTGYAKLLKVLLNKVGISSLDYIYKVYERNDKEVINKGDNQDKEIKDFKHYSHQRDIIMINDDKYNVHGVYISDPTQDNEKRGSSYNHALFTFDKNKRTSVLQSLSSIDCLFDFHNQKDFYEKIDYLVRTKYQELSNISDVIKEIFSEMMEYLYRLDYSKYLYFKKKYDELSYKYDVEEKEESDINVLQKSFGNMLGEYYEYIINYSNKEIDYDVIANASFNIKKMFGIVPEDVRDTLVSFAKQNNEQRDEKYFPHIYDPTTNQVYDLESDDHMKEKSDYFRRTK